MEVEQVRRMKEELEDNIQEAIHALVDDFQAATGVQVASLDIGMLETEMLGFGKKSIITGCNVSLEI